MLMHNKLSEAAKFIESRLQVKPKLGIILGSGLGGYVERVEDPVTIPYTEIPHFLPTTVDGHAGKLIGGYLRNPLKKEAIPVVVLQGRFHHYEGHSLETVVFPARTICLLGIDTLLLTNAAGGINPEFRESDLMLITDHLNFMHDNPLRGPNLKELGPRFPDLSEAYNKDCLNAFRRASEKLGLDLKEGVYAAVTGPTYETPAEVRMLRALGADAVGMSTVPEAIAANHLGVRVAALSCITNLATGLSPRKTSHVEVMQNAEKAIHRLLTLLDEAVYELGYKPFQEESTQL